LERPRRRTFKAQDKLRILGEVDRAADVPRAVGAIVSAIGLAASACRRRLRSAEPAKRGPKTAEPNALAAELARSRRDNLRLKQRLERAEAIIELQKKLRRCWPPHRRATAGLDVKTVTSSLSIGFEFWVFSIRRIAVKHFQALGTFDYFCHSRALSSLRDQLFGSPIMGSEG
jgi:hypothetical protein